MSLRQATHIVLSRWRLVLAGVALVMAAALAQVFLTVPVYTASTQVYLSSTTRAAETGSYVLTDTDLERYVDVLVSPSVQDPLRRALGLPPTAPIAVSGSISSTSLLTLTASGSDPHLVARIANATPDVLSEVARQFSPLLATNGQGVTSTVITPATVPSAPVTPNLRRSLALGGIAGLGLGIGFAFLLNAFDTRIRKASDLLEHSSRPVVGEIPLVRDAQSLSGSGPVGYGTYAEAIRRLRVSVAFLDATTEAHAMVVTSSVPGEGKTTVAVNLAHAIAEAGSRVLLVDGDLRNPSVGTIMALSNSVGLTDILLGEASLEDAVQPYRNTGLHVLTAGRQPPNPAELLGSRRMRAWMESVQQQYDFILFDSPPLVPVIDAVLLGELSQGLLMVVALDHAKKSDLATSLQILETVEVDVSGFAINMAAHPSSAAYGYPYVEAPHTRAQRRRSRRGSRKKRRQAAAAAS